MLIQYSSLDNIILHSIAILNSIKSNGIFITNYSCHRLILISLLLAAKISEDYLFTNLDWAYCGGVTLSNINNMEYTCLSILNFNVFISSQKLLYIHKSIY